ncbi:MAG: hypothetical protein ACR2RA_11570 [Geminicoccaceae bacterium]
MIRTKPERISAAKAAKRIGCLALVCALGACATPTLADHPPRAVTDQIERTLPDYSWRENDRHIGFGDFDANGLDDVAMLLSGSDDWQLVVFRQMEDERYQTDVIEQFPGNDHAFKQRFPPDDLAIEAVAKGGALDLDGTIIDDAATDAASLALRLPAAEQTALLFKWNPAQQLFGTSRLRLAEAPSGTSCAYDPQSGVPNPLGMRAFVTVEERDGNTTFVYERFPETLEGVAPATLAMKRELVFHQTPIDQARALMREQPSYYQQLTDDDDPAGFAPIDATLVCQ